MRNPRFRTPRNSAIVMGALLALGVSDAQAQVQAEVTWWRVARHADVVDVDASVYDTAFTRATTALTVDNGTNDIACSLRLARAGLRWWFSGGGSDDNVDNQTEYEDTQFNSSDAYQIVVDEINWCLTAGAYDGCGWPQGGFAPFLIDRALMVGSSNGIAVAHEYGHTIGLGHSPTALNVMNAVAGSTNNKVGANQCSSLRFCWGRACKASGDNWGPLPSVCSVAAPAGSSFQSLVLDDGTLAEQQAAFTKARKPLPIEVLGRMPILDHVPVWVEDHYDHRDVAALRLMLKDPSLEGHHRTIASLIGLISDGSDADVQALEAYAKRGTDVAAAMFGLGYIAARKGHQGALDVIKSGLNSPHSDIAEAATHGLTVSGNPEAHGLLVAISAAEPAVTSRRHSGAQAKQNGDIRRIGFRAFYENPPIAVQSADAKRERPGAVAFPE